MTSKALGDALHGQWRCTGCVDRVYTRARLEELDKEGEWDWIFVASPTRQLSIPSCPECGAPLSYEEI